MDFIRSNWRDMLFLTEQHLLLVTVSTFFAIAIGIPLGILLTRRPRLRGPVLGFANIMQTVPSLALFGFLIPLPFIGGIGARTAIVALVLYSLLPIIRNTTTGILNVDRNVREAAAAMGMTDRQILFQVELPLAMSVILTGVRVAVVISVGVATIAAAVGAGGLGTYIFRGLRQNNDISLILAGAVPSALMAVTADLILGSFEKRFDTTRRIKAKRNPWVLGVALAVLIAVIGVGGYSLLKPRAEVVVGSKDFTESVILAEIFAQMLEANGLRVERRFEFGGSLAHAAILSGEIDCYPEYTGTAFTSILKQKAITDPQAVYDRVKREYSERFDLAIGPPLGFSNDFAILVRGEVARRLNLATISDAARFTRDWRAGFGQDFMSREDGYPGFSRAYGLEFRERPREMDLSLTYRALKAGEVDLIAGNSTDGLIAANDLVQLEDDRRFFPPYQAVMVARRDAIARQRMMNEVISKLDRLIRTADMRRMNLEVDGGKRAVVDVAREWIRANAN